LPCAVVFYFVTVRGIYLTAASPYNLLLFESPAVTSGGAQITAEYEARFLPLDIGAGKL
jgi:hypothetical protein